MNVLELEKVYFKRGFFSLADINLTLKENETVAVVGRSGAGKTTLFELLGNVVRPAGGYIRYFGMEMYENEAEIRRSISVMFGEPNFNTEYNSVALAKYFHRVEPSFDEAGFRQRLKKFDIDESKRIKVLSKGTRKKLQVSFFLSRNPRILMMDEPTSGLDEMSREMFFGMIEEYRQSRPLAVLFSTHSQDDVSLYADRILKIENGGVR